MKAYLKLVPLTLRTNLSTYNIFTTSRDHHKDNALLKLEDLDYNPCYHYLDGKYECQGDSLK